ncbi:META domain-containing protein [Synechococcus sp. 1G10]|uniref:META domain-containing protein n=1 Tax=Synechococcus sp. 1G10 TaxID=2025605 RepID=UPI001E5B64D1|nr:META domain-containing protein [Synechococcus sp. 1G10]
MVVVSAAIAASFLLPGGEGTSLAKPTSSGAPLAGTQWRLLEIQSMDDAQGITRPADPSRYTLRFNSDGTLQLRLDCNRASGTWSARPSADPSNGSLRLGPLASTKALCPSPSLGERLGAQTTFVRGYLLRDGRLNLSLLADGGILVWEPINQAGHFSATPDPKLEAAILRASPGEMHHAIGGKRGSARGSYVYARYDLNGDGRDEVFAYLMGSNFCGTGGCTMQIFRQSGNYYRLMNSFPITRLPVIISATRTQGWNDFWKRESGGGAPLTYVRHIYDGRRYVARKRVPAIPTPAGTSILSGDPTLTDGIPLVLSN